MKTKTIVIGENKNLVNQKPIEFDKILSDNLGIWNAKEKIQKKGKPSDYNFIELICKDYGIKNQDLMFAYNDSNNRDEGCLFIGKWNDGIVDN